jgi:AAA domain
MNETPHNATRLAAIPDEGNATATANSVGTTPKKKWEMYPQGFCVRCRKKALDGSRYCYDCALNATKRCAECKKYPAGWYGNPRSPICKVCADKHNQELDAERDEREAKGRAEKARLESVNGQTALTHEEAKASGQEFNNKGRTCRKCKAGMVTTVTALMCDACEVAEFQAKAVLPEERREELWRSTDENGVIHQIVGVTASKVKPKAQRWLWKHWIPIGITWFYGLPGGAKSLSTCEFAAIVSTGRSWPDGTPNAAGARKVAIYNAEDDLDRTVIPRLIAAKADMDNIILLDHSSFRTYDPTGKEGSKHSLDLTADLPKLSAFCATEKDIALVIADPITGIFGGKNVNHDKEVVKVLENLKLFCEKRNVTFIGISHTNKRTDVVALQSMLGGSSMPAKARAMYQFDRDPDSDDKHDHVMAFSKNNLSDNKRSMRLRTAGMDMTLPDDDGKMVTEAYPYIVWGETTEDDADAIAAKKKEKRERKDTKLSVAKDMILALIAEKPMMS